MVRKAARCGNFFSLTDDRSDNDMYGRREPVLSVLLVLTALIDHMNNSVYSFLYLLSGIFSGAS